MELFDHNRLYHNRLRAIKNFPQYDFLYRQAHQEIYERLTYIQKDMKNFLEMGGRLPVPSYFLEKKKNFIAMNITPPTEKNDLYVQGFEEYLPFKENMFDGIVSHFNIHHLHDIQNFFNQVHFCLKPKGVFLASFLGEETLKTVLYALQRAEEQLGYNIENRFHPTISANACSQLLLNAHFHLPVVDCNPIKINYSSLTDLFHDIRYMGEGAIFKNFSRKPLNQKIIELTEKYYPDYEKYCESHWRYKDVIKRPKPESFSVTFNIIYLIAWKN